MYPCRYLRQPPLVALNRFDQRVLDYMHVSLCIGGLQGPAEVENCGASVTWLQVTIQ